ncbi:MAG: EAL domain-containing protein [Solobacterium sp.]|nr:EAL domain-containing protein [Solobacterium sp.]
MEENRQELEQLWEFIRLMKQADVPSPKAIRQAIGYIADSIHLGRLVGELQTEKTPVYPDGYYEKTVFYTSDEGFVTDDAVSIMYDVKEPGKVTMTACHRPGEPFPEVRQVVAVLELVNLAAESYFMIGKADRQALMQALTGLPNASGYMREVGRMFQERIIDQFDAYYFNLASYGLINKQFGQKEGDEVMCRITAILRASLADDEVLGHLGGDNFVALIHQGENSLKFRELLSCIETYAMRGTQKFPLTISAVIGMMKVEPLTPAEQIISGPAVACSFAKKTKSPFVVLDDELNERINRSKMIEQKFEQALADHEFEVYYQPKVNAATGELIGAEALARWIDQGQVVPPAYFIPVLEESYRITELDFAVFEMVCRDLAKWEASGTVYPVSVNFSRQDLLDPNLFERTLAVMKKYGVRRGDIVIEITETSSEKEKDMMMKFLRQLREHGIRTSIDDFGTGYSSLSILREFPVSEIKLDRSFINKELDEKDRIIIESVIDMARRLKIQIIQEGVETEEQKEFIMNLGCDRIQGYLYSKPLPRVHYEEWVKRGKSPEAE